MAVSLYERYRLELAHLTEQGLYKTERKLKSAQSARVSADGEASRSKTFINLCANNYLGLANNPEIIQASALAMEEYGFGMASVRFICGTAEIHRQLEIAVAEMLGMDDAILYACCFDANGGVFEPLLNADDAIVSDSLNHASIIDGVRLCKAKRYRFQNNDMADLEEQLSRARSESSGQIIVASDGVFSMDGYITNLPELRRLADKLASTVKGQGSILASQRTLFRELLARLWVVRQVGL
jgi:glycine C-acetyltransferase